MLLRGHNFRVACAMNVQQTPVIKKHKTRTQKIPACTSIPKSPQCRVFSSLHFVSPIIQGAKFYFDFKQLSVTAQTLPK
jgi:hypothetical protein